MSVTSENVVKHTPGPWKIKGPDRVEGDYAILADGFIIAQAYKQTDDDRFEPVDANARLIAAAPELLKECEKSLEAFLHIQQYIEPSMIDEDGIKQLKAAIAKAKGGGS